MDLINYLAWQPPEKESVLYVSACDWSKFAGRLSRPQWGISGHLQLPNRARPYQTSAIDALAVTAEALSDWPAG